MALTPMTHEDFVTKLNLITADRRTKRVDNTFPPAVETIIKQLKTGPVQDLEMLLLLSFPSSPQGTAQPASPVCCLYLVNNTPFCVCQVSPDECTRLGGQQVSSCNGLRGYNV